MLDHQSNDIISTGTSMWVGKIDSFCHDLGYIKEKVLKNEFLQKNKKSYQTNHPPTPPHPRCFAIDVKLST